MSTNALNPMQLIGDDGKIAVAIVLREPNASALWNFYCSAVSKYILFFSGYNIVLPLYINIITGR